MNAKKLTKKETDFCRMYVRLRNPREAAVRAGFTTLPECRAIGLLSKKNIRQKINEIEKESLADETLISAGLQRLAFGSISDAVKLILSADKNTSPDIDSLDLFNVSEIKFTSGKGMEIKFFDRLKALERLSLISQNGNELGALSFYEALERSAINKTESEDSVTN
ncbi:MAG: terminase small subunit [Clostridia bacterium]|nr:terminase small subunit [Clostridia bacterium]